jgi:hypothetical protein
MIPPNQGGLPNKSTQFPALSAQSFPTKPLSALQNCNPFPFNPRFEPSRVQASNDLSALLGTNALCVARILRLNPIARNSLMNSQADRYRTPSVPKSDTSCQNDYPSVLF